MNKKLFNLLDLLKFLKLSKERKNRIINSNDDSKNYPPVNKLAQELHPPKIILVIKKIIDETSDVKTFILEADKKHTNQLPYFLPGQYISINIKDKNTLATRSFSISSSPKLTLEKNQFTVTIKKVLNSFSSNIIFNKWKIGSILEAHGPFGRFTFNPIRDCKDLVAIAGSCGITPFMSLAQAIEDKTINNINSLTILYGNKTEHDIIAKKYFDEVSSRTNGRIKCIYILSSSSFVKADNIEYGFITSEIIKKYLLNVKTTYFICGNNKMYGFVKEQLNKLNIEKKYIHYEGLNLSEIVLASEEYKQQKLNSEYRIEVHFNNNVRNIKARGSETILVALERNGIFMSSACRAGKCGRCVARLVSGNVYVPSNFDARRISEKKYNFIYTCCTFPASDDIIIEFNSQKQIF